MVSPSTLTPYDTNGHWSQLNYVWARSETGYEVYTRGNTTNAGGHEIKVNTSTNSWHDLGGDHPHQVQEFTDPNGVVYIELYSTTLSPTLLKRLIKPTVADWIPVEPATGTEGTSSSSGSCQLIYNAATNVMHYFMNATEPSTDMLSTRNLYYRVRNTTNVSTDVIFSHTIGTHTNHDFIPTVYGVYHLEKVLTNPLEVLSCDSASVTQSNIVAYNAANTPPNTPRSRRGNLNFW